MQDTPRRPGVPLAPLSFDGPLGRQIVELHVWVVREGIRGVPPRRFSMVSVSALWSLVCRCGAPLPECRHCIRSGADTATPGGASSTPLSRGNSCAATSTRRILLNSPIGYLIRQGEGRGNGLGRRGEIRGRIYVVVSADPRRSSIFRFSASSRGGRFRLFRRGRPLRRGWATPRTVPASAIPLRRIGRPAFSDDDLLLLQAVLPAVSLAMMTHAGHTIASGLLGAYLGGDAGRRVHAGAVERGSVESVRAVLWYADIRGFTTIADTTPGLVVIELLDAIFETLTASLRPRGGQVLKFLGDGMLAIFPFVEMRGTRSAIKHSMRRRKR